MNIRDILETIKERIPKLPFGRKKKEEEEEFLDEGIDLEEEPPAPEPEPEPEPIPAPEPEMPPAPEKPLPSPTSVDVGEQLKRLTMHFETLETELEMIKSETDLEKSMIEKYDYYLKDMNKKLTLLEQQHESIWNEIQTKKSTDLQ